MHKTFYSILEKYPQSHVKHPVFQHNFAFLALPPILTSHRILRVHLLGNSAFSPLVRLFVS